MKFNVSYAYKTTLVLSLLLAFPALANEPAYSSEEIVISNQDSVDEINTNLVRSVAPGSDKELELLCENITEPARERRYAIQKAQLEALKADLEQRLALLDTKRDELEMWVKKREQFAEMANQSVVDVYASMDAAAAAERLANMDGGLSAALLMKLKARSAASILSEMDPKKASFVTGIMAASSDKKLEQQ